MHGHGVGLPGDEVIESHLFRRFSAGGGGTTIADLSTWDSKPSGTTDGDYGLGPNGLVYRWIAASSMWVPASRDSRCERYSDRLDRRQSVRRWRGDLNRRNSPVNRQWHGVKSDRGPDLSHDRRRDMGPRIPLGYWTERLPAHHCGGHHARRRETPQLRPRLNW